MCPETHIAEPRSASCHMQGHSTRDAPKQLWHICQKWARQSFGIPRIFLQGHPGRQHEVWIFEGPRQGDLDLRRWTGIMTHEFANHRFPLSKRAPGSRLPCKRTMGKNLLSQQTKSRCYTLRLFGKQLAMAAEAHVGEISSSVQVPQRTMSRGTQADTE